MAYASTAERMLAAIGEPEIVDTSRDPRMGRIFMNRSIRIYPSFADFYGMEETIERIVGYFRHAAQGLEERKQVLYLLGPVGGGKSSLAERLKLLMEKMPIYALKAGKDISPVFESPLGLFDPIRMGDTLEKNYKIPKRRLTGLASPWALKRLDEFGGDISKFTVVRVNPSRLRQICIAKTEPGDENNQDISSLVGKVDIRKLEFFSQNDADAYAYSGGLNRTSQGLLEFVEMFKAPIKMLHPLLTATQESNYIGSENIGAIPYQGIILAHSNEAEWQTFKNNRNNEAFIDRICVIKVPYCGRATEERRIYEKLLSNSELAGSPCAPGTLDMLSRFCVLSRLKTHENSNLYSKMRAYDGESLKDSDPRAKTVQEYRDAAGVDEGMEGLSTRFAFKVLSSTFNYDTQEVSADPVHLMYVLEQSIRREQFSEDNEKRLLAYIKAELAPRYAEFIGNEIQKAYLESYGDYGQNLFDRYVAYADAWIEDQDFKDPDTGQLMDRELLNQELSKIEKPAGIANPKDFRNEVVKFALRSRASHGGKNPSWTSYEKLREVIEKRMFSQVEDLLPVISFGSKKDSDTEKKHGDFLERMVSRGYTQRQVRRLVEWYMRVNKAG
jgi:serine protein kinase